MKIGPVDTPASGSVGHAGEHDLARRVAAHREIEFLVLGREREPAQALEGIAPPRTVIHPVPHRFAVFAVAGDVDPEFVLPPHDIDGRGAELRLQTRLVHRLTGATCLIGLDQLVRPRQAASMAGQDALVAAFHGCPPDAPRAYTEVWAEQTMARARGRR
jgi:hypothetical protein